MLQCPNQTGVPVMGICGCLKAMHVCMGMDLGWESCVLHSGISGCISLPLTTSKGGRICDDIHRPGLQLFCGPYKMSIQNLTARAQYTS